MGPAPTPPVALDAVRRTQTVAASMMAPEPRAFISDAKALEVAVTRDVARQLKADPKSVEWQKPQVDALLAQWAAEQAKLVAKLEADVLADVAERVEGAAEGEDLRAIVTARFAANEARAKFIARNELGNLMAQLVQLRAKGMGAHRYRWMSRDDARVRPLHAALDGTVRSWDDPHPTEGHPGDAAGCRCVALPLRDDAIAVKAKATVTATPPPAVLPPRPPAPKPVPKPKPVTVPTLPPVEVPPPAALPPLPTFTPTRLPTFPGVEGVRTVPQLTPMQPPKPLPPLPELVLPKLVPPPPPTLVLTVAPRPTRSGFVSEEAYRKACRDWWFGEGAGSVRAELVYIDASSAGGEANLAKVEWALKQIPAHVQDLLIRRGSKVGVFGTLIDWSPKLKGVRPRGWDEGSSWEDVRGLALRNNAVIAVKSKAGGFGLSETTLHELGHTADSGERLSRDRRFQEAYERFTKNEALQRWAVASGKSPDYFLQPGTAGPSEAWAELFAAAMDPLRRATLERYMPGITETLAEILNDDTP